MATHKLGKLKFNISGDGLAFRFGDGEIHRLSIGKKKKEDGQDYDADAYTEDAGDVERDYAEDGEEAGYDDRYSRAEDDDYPEYDDDRDYDDRDYDDRDYDDRDYDAHDFDDRDYDDRDYDDQDGYDDRDYDDGYAEEDGEYDDRYLDEDAGDYAPESYADENPVLRYIDENDWVTYVFLFLLPPLGIYLLWRRRRFEMPIRWIVSAASGVWFIIAMILIISALLSGTGDTTTNAGLTFTTGSPTPSVSASVTPSPSSSVNPDATVSDLLSGLTATATPIASVGGSSDSGDTTGTGDSGTSTVNGQETVYMPATGLYYHKTSTCSNIPANTSLSVVTVDVAKNRGQSECPTCYGASTLYYATTDGKYYHSDQTCSGMTTATTITEEAAKSAGKTACPVCILKSQNTLSDNALKFATSSTTDQSGVTVFATKNGKYFHTDSTCSGMQNPTSGTLLEAMLQGKTACPTCCKAAGTMVYATKNGKYYHNQSNCSGMTGAAKVTLAEAMVLGKKRCPVCLGKTSSSSSSTVSTAGSTTIAAAGDASSSSSTGGVYVYGTANGKYYHTDQTCSGMTNATRYTLKSMITAGRQACPTCCKGADTTVYAAKGGSYYHSFATCSGMTQAYTGTLAQALAYGYKKCPNCWTSSSADTSKSDSAAAADTNSSGTTTGATDSGTGSYVYCTTNGNYYHTQSSCSGMTGASRVHLSTAVAAGKTACPVCASAAKRTVYSTERGTYYHSRANCSGMTGASARTLEAALMLGQTACPVCIGASSTANSTSPTTAPNATAAPGSTISSSGTFKAGTSGVRVYATADGRYYHTKSSCSGMVNPSYITLETALNYGKTGCPICASSANTTVYAVRGGKYYHYSKACAGSGANAGTRAEALAYGLDPCPYCVTKSQKVTSSDTFKPGTSGIKVYASASGKYYHTSKSHAGSGASYITLETALNYGKIACPDCAGSAGKTVYSTASDKYYHTSKAHAGSGAVAGTLAKALAYGKSACPDCIGGSESYEVSDIEYAASGSTSVYIDMDSDMLYYHKSSSCSEAGFSNGTKVTLDFVVGWGYKACPYCNPPTSVSN